MASGKGLVERLRRVLRTAFFMVTMVASLLLFSATVVVAVADVVVPSSLLPVFSGRNLRPQFARYGFRHSLIDVPLISVVRSLIITSVYSLCDSPCLSHGPYLGTVTFCSLSSILILSVKACLFRGIPEEDPGSISMASSVQRKLHLKQSWGMPILFMSSLVFALGHVVVAYRASCRARKKLLFHRGDQESVFGFPGYLKVPRSPTPTSGKGCRSDCEGRRRPATATAAVAAREEGYLPIRLLSDVDSLFMTYQGILLHYKLNHPDSPVSQSLACSAFLEDNPLVSSPRGMPSRLKLDRPLLSVPSKSLHLHRSFSNPFDDDSLYAPLLTGSTGGSILPDEIPALKLDDHDKEQTFSSHNNKENLAGLENGPCGIVLIHGFGGGVFSWRHVMGPLARQTRCTVSAFDRPGWGLTSRPRRSEWEAKQLPNPYHLDSQVDLLLDFCLAMGFSSVVLVGHDDGGLIALKAAQKVQSTSKFMQVDIRGVVLLNVNLSREVIPGFARILLHTSLGKKHMVRPLLRTEITQVVNRRAWYDSKKLTPEVMSLYKAPLCVEGWDEALQEIGKLSFASVLSPQNASLLLEAVGDLPVLVVAGAEDALVSLKTSQALSLKLLNSRLVAISGCGHLPHEECPKALLAALSPFISRLLADHCEGVQ
ncbi:uncharacterized protein LOC116245632 [Nymphaea colorata]|nr:uncharacterized protein LOC116245632 [Nymphaea colorata]